MRSKKRKEVYKKVGVSATMKEIATLRALCMRLKPFYSLLGLR
jgi:hypothetical protein